MTTTSNGSGTARIANALRRLAGGRVHRAELARERLDHPLLAVEDHVEGEVRRRGGRRGADVVVDGVALDDAPGRLRVADAGGVVEHEHGVQPGEPGRDELRPAAEAGEEVRLDEAGGDPQVGLDPARG